MVLVQTRDGYIWLGTEAGLVRFDGVRFTTFDRHNTPALKGHFVRALAEAPDGTLWIGTHAGALIRYRDGVFTPFGRQHGLPETGIHALLVDRSGVLWIGMARAGLARWNGSRLDRFERRPLQSMEQLFSQVGADDRDDLLHSAASGERRASALRGLRRNDRCELHGGLTPSARHTSAPSATSPVEA